MALKQYSCCRPYKNVYPSRAKWCSEDCCLLQSLSSFNILQFSIHRVQGKRTSV
ncbi:hypothetical protein BVRB_5g104460 isoform A [Beta vulgaris subsp. vulgaris]|uniref:Uncharacterized protein n=1 Tax=Beta vulgaris subsp. vulgaris TaxID=3555 RepID=A0A0J8CEB8_BETVV|nr:hypothetical protein BVRB_5g104460 isoform A [Beta vulgaris subsp. vulgaris]